MYFIGNEKLADNKSTNQYSCTNAGIKCLSAYLGATCQQKHYDQGNCTFIGDEDQEDGLSDD